ncbi:MAG: GDP-mannose 4,6-dehydratase, partial [Calditrichia bacterium]|nr:GDP-mannose 4,6-dehydratase [Calditrichia bacterium]
IALPVYGDGMNIRDWLYVEDNCTAYDVLLHNGKPGEIYNIGGGNEKSNIEITKLILKYTGKDESLIKYVKDRPAHDKRYSVDISKMKSLGWEPEHNFDEAIEQTVKWYIKNEDWWRKIKEKQESFKEYYKKQYEEK